MSTPHPPVATPEEWRAARLALLEEEKAHTRAYDRVNAARRRLPMVPIEKTYEFDAPEGRITLGDLFGGKRQLIVYHFMFAPEWEEGCGGCTGYVDALGDLSLLDERDTTFALVSRAPLEKLLRYKTARGWDNPERRAGHDRRWVSSFGSDFNYDFHATLDESKAPVEYNYFDKATLEEKGMTPSGEWHGTSVFFRLPDEEGGTIFHTYSTYGRSTETATTSYGLLDLTPYGRQEDFEDSPAGFPQKPTYG